MRRWKMDSCVIKFLAGLVLLYMFIVSLELPFVFKTGFSAVSQERSNKLSNDTVSRQIALGSEEELEEKEAPVRPPNDPHRASNQQPSQSKPQRRMIANKTLSSLSFDGGFVNPTGKDGFSGIQKLAKEAFELGKKLWNELELGKARDEDKTTIGNQTGSCPNSISLSGYELADKGQIVMLPCGLKLGSHITLVGKPRHAHAEYYPKIPLLKEGQYVMVSQFVMEIQGLKTVHGEDPTKILHFNPRLKGDWSGKPVIEQNTCYRTQWGSALRCEGSKSRADEETVDGQLKCEKWIIARDYHSEESKATWWANRVIGRTNKVTVDWPFPFTEDKLFVLTLRAGLEGYHVHVNGRHVTSFPYRTGFTLEDAAGLSLNGDVDVHSIFVTSLPTSHLNFDPQRLLEISGRWQSPPLPDEPVGLFIGILSAGNHFAERMALRKSWMQHMLIKSSNVVARFFVALHARKEVNAVLKKEAELFGDIVIVPYMDNYDLVVLKTVAIAEFGIQTVPATYIMKCDDDTFVRVDAVIEEVKKVPGNKSFYMGNINYYHKPLRHGKWAVTYQEWPEATYPPYANGPGYVVSSDIAHFIVSEFKNHNLRLFKMEDVSMGMWVGQFNSSRPVDYIHSWKFCQFGCVEDYYTAHYQSPKQIMCLWNKLQEQGRALCCNMR